MTTYNTTDDVRDMVTTALGEWADDHDIDAIVDHLYDVENGKIVVDADPGQFWTIVQQHAK